MRVAIIVDDYVLTVRNWMGDRNWRLPGGGIKPGEEAKAAVIREMNEELGVKLTDSQVNWVATAKTRESGVDFIGEYFMVILKKRPAFKLKPVEVMGTNWQKINGTLNKVLKKQLDLMKIRA